MEAVLALVVMTSIDHEPWRWLLGLTSLPMLLVILLFIVSNRLSYVITSFESFTAGFLGFYNPCYKIFTCVRVCVCMCVCVCV